MAATFAVSPSALGRQDAAESVTPVLVFPRDGSRTASPRTEISLRNIDPALVAEFEVTGSLTGRHTGVFSNHSDGFGASYLPDSPFAPGETVTVEADFALSSDGRHAIEFIVATPRALPGIEQDRETETPEFETQRFRSRPDLVPPQITVTDKSPGASSDPIFVGVKTKDGQNGPMILDGNGDLIGFWPYQNSVASVNDFKVQEYLGQPVLTWWDGVSDRGEGFGHFVILDENYAEIEVIRVGNGLSGADLHELQLTSRGTAMIVSYHRVVWDLSELGGPALATVVDSIIQEIDIPTGHVLFEWHSLDHIDVAESFSSIPETSLEKMDYAHVNSIERIDDTTLLISARNTHAIYKIDMTSGDIIWRLHGKLSDFDMDPDAVFAWQHDARLHPSGTLTLFDNHSSDDSSGEHSRGLELSLNEETGVASVVKEFPHPTGILSVSQGNTQRLDSGNTFVGWGSAPVFSEFANDGSLVFNGRFPDLVNSYRAFRYPWTGTPSDIPAIAFEARGANTVTLFASWNGATRVAGWRWLAGESENQLSAIEFTERTGFETRTTVSTAARYFAVQAEDSIGNVLGVSEPISRF